MTRYIIQVCDIGYQIGKKNLCTRLVGETTSQLFRACSLIATDKNVFKATSRDDRIHQDLPKVYNKDSRRVIIALLL